MNQQQQQLQQCIQDCQDTLNKLQSFTNKTQDVRLKSTLTESAHHLDMCVRECQFATKQVP